MLLRIVSPLKSIIVAKMRTISISLDSWLHPEVIMNRTGGMYDDRDVFTKAQSFKNENENHSVFLLSHLVSLRHFFSEGGSYL